MAMSTDYIAIDLGSSYAKAAAPDVTITIPSVVMRLDGPRAGAINVAGTWYAVGQDALDMQRERDEQPHRGADYHGSVEQQVLWCELARRLVLAGVAAPRAIIINLPYFLIADEAVRQRIRNGLFSRAAWMTAAGEAVEFRADVIKFAPQGGGAIMEFFDRSQCRRESIRYAMAVDIGGHTTDVVTLAPGPGVGAEKIIDGASASASINVMQFYADLVERIRALPGHDLESRPFSYYAIMDAIAAGEDFVRHQGERVSIATPLAEARRDFTRQVEREVMRAASDWWPDIDVVLLTGGGAALVDLETWPDRRLHVLDATANVVGQVRMAKQVQTRAPAAESPIEQPVDIKPATAVVAAAPVKGPATKASARKKKGKQNGTHTISPST